MKIYLETERLRLREFVPEDFDFIKDLDSSSAVMRYISDGTPSTDDIVQSTIDSFLKWPHRAGGYYGYWLAENKDTGDAIGWFQLRPLKEDMSNYDNLEIGYRLKEEYWGHGFTTEVSKALVNLAFMKLKAKEVWAITMINNHASQNVMKKCGLVFDREDVFSEYKGKDKRCVWYCIGRAEFKENKRSRLNFREATQDDAKACAKLHSIDNPQLIESNIEVFKREFEECEKIPSQRTYFLAFDEKELIAFAGARFYDQDQHENMYKTKKLLPTGWYLRGIRVNRDWQRLGIARLLTQKRLNWLNEKSERVYVYLTDENKETIPMYRELGFEDHSRGWEYLSEEIDKKGLLLSKTFS